MKILSEKFISIILKIIKNYFKIYKKTLIHQKTMKIRYKKNHYYNNKILILIIINKKIMIKLINL
jgi:hypothetical protein